MTAEISGQKTQKLKHIDALDGARGFAVLLVMMFHFAVNSLGHPDTQLDKIIYAMAATGWLGVDLFFVLSGFLITGILLETKASPNYFRNFFARRSLRIFPLYFAFLATMVWILPNLSNASAVNFTINAEAPWCWSYLYNFKTAILGWSDTSIFTHLWSLAVEEQFYLIWPFVIWKLKPRTLTRLCSFLIFMSLAARIGFWRSGYPVASYTLMPARIDALAIGSLIALTPPGNLFRKNQVAWLIFATSLFFLISTFIYSHGLYKENFGTVTLGISAAGIFFGSCIILSIDSRGSFLNRFFSLKLLRTTGKYSYSLYLFNFPI